MLSDLKKACEVCDKKAGPTRILKYWNEAEHFGAEYGRADVKQTSWIVCSQCLERKMTLNPPQPPKPPEPLDLGVEEEDDAIWASKLINPDDLFKTKWRPAKSGTPRSGRAKSSVLN